MTCPAGGRLRRIIQDDITKEPRFATATGKTAVSAWRGRHRIIVRIWHGRTPRERADEYGALLTMRAIPDYRAVPGNLDVSILRRDEGEVSHFLTVTLWESEEAIRAFAGDEVLKARYYPEDSEFLLEFEPEVQHFTVVSKSP